MARQRQWGYEIAAGLNGKTGNSESLGTDISAKAELEGPEDQLRFYGRYRYSETDDQVRDDEAKGGVRYINNFTGDWLWYIRGEMGRDAVRDLDLYTEAAAGLGYKLIDEPNHNLVFLGGLAHRSEVYGSGRNESFPAMDLSLEHDYTWQWAKLVNTLGYTQSLSDMDQYTITHTSEIEVPVGDNKNWKWRAGVENDYDGAPNPGVESLDTTYFTKLVYTFN
jgi:putative salt-induced outer membrane protein YdiY